MRRVRVVIVIVIAVALSFGWAAALRPHGKFLSTVQVTLTPPPVEATRWVTPNNPIAPDQRSSLIELAGITARAVSGLHRPVPAVSGDVTLLDAGVYRGWSVTQPNNGGQWSYSFSEAGMQVQASGSSPQDVVATIEGVVARIESSVTAREAAAHVSPDNRVSFLVSSTPPSVMFVTGSKKRAMAGMLLLSILLMAAAMTLDRHLGQR